MNRRKHVHLGDRLAAIDRVRRGCAAEEVARDLGVTEQVVVEWQQRHAGERTLSLDELRHAASPEEQRLAERARRLSALLADADRELRALHEELIRSLPASNEPIPAEADHQETGRENTRWNDARVAGATTTRVSSRIR